MRSLNSLLKSINFSKEKYPNVEIRLIIIDDNTNEANLNKINNLTNNSNFEVTISKVDHDKYRELIKAQKNDQTYSNLSSLLCCYEIAKKILMI